MNRYHHTTREWATLAGAAAFSAAVLWWVFTMNADCRRRGDDYRLVRGFFGYECVRIAPAP